MYFPLCAWLFLGSKLMLCIYSYFKLNRYFPSFVLYSPGVIGLLYVYLLIMLLV